MPEPPTPEQLAAANALRVLKLVAATLPHLSGLCHSVRVKVTRKYGALTSLRCSRCTHLALAALPHWGQALWLHE